MNLVISVITAPRGRSVIRRSLESLRSIGGFSQEKVIVSSDGRCDDSITDYADVIVENEKPLGNFRNWVQALELGIATREADYVMVCEDDIVWASGARDALSREVFQVTRDDLSPETDSRIGALSLYLPNHEERHIQGAHRRHSTSGLLTDGWHVGAKMGRSTWGAQCMVFSRSQASSLLLSSMFRQMRADPKWQKNVDGIVAACLNDMGKTIAYRVPCLVNHAPLGEGNSSLGYPDDRPGLRTRYFTGSAGW